MKYVGAFVNPKDMTRYSYNPYLVEKVVLGISSGLNLMVTRLQINLGEYFGP
jgi:hypothetical protein